MEEQVPEINKTVVMHNDQVIWSGLEQEDIALIYNYLKELINSNLYTTHIQPGHIAKFLIADSIKAKLQTITTANTSQLLNQTNDYYELDIVHLGKSCQKYYLIPYNLSKLTFFIFIKVNETFKLGILNKIDEILGSSMITLLQEIADQQLKITMNTYYYYY